VGSWSSFFSSCFMRPDDLARHMNVVRPEALVVGALRDYAFDSGRGLVVLVQPPAARMHCSACWSSRA